MYAITMVLFLIPMSILGFAWRGELRGGGELAHRDWRSFCVRLALIFASVATLTAMGFWLSWTHRGGSPHGLMPARGLWLPLREIAKWSVVGTVTFGAFGKGKGRLLAIGSAISIFFVIFILAALEMD
jgi:hypothetical protein